MVLHSQCVNEYVLTLEADFRANQMDYTEVVTLQALLRKFTPH